MTSGNILKYLLLASIGVTFFVLTQSLFFMNQWGSELELYQFVSPCTVSSNEVRTANKMLIGIHHLSCCSPAASGTVDIDIIQCPFEFVSASGIDIRNATSAEIDAVRTSIWQQLQTRHAVNSIVSCWLQISQLMELQQTCIDQAERNSAENRFQIMRIIVVLSGSYFMVVVLTICVCTFFYSPRISNAVAPEPPPHVRVVSETELSSPSSRAGRTVANRQHDYSVSFSGID